MLSQLQPHLKCVMHPSATRPSNRLHRLSGYPRSKKKALHAIWDRSRRTASSKTTTDDEVSQDRHAPPPLPLHRLPAEDKFSPLRDLPPLPLPSLPANVSRLQDRRVPPPMPLPSLPADDEVSRLQDQLDLPSLPLPADDEFSHLQDRRDLPPLPLPSLPGGAPRTVVLVRHGQVGGLGLRSFGLPGRNQDEASRNQGSLGPRESGFTGTTLM